MSIHGLVILWMIHQNKEAVFRILPCFANCAATGYSHQTPDRYGYVDSWVGLVFTAGFDLPAGDIPGFVERPAMRYTGTRAVGGCRCCQSSTDGWCYRQS